MRGRGQEKQKRGQVRETDRQRGGTKRRKTERKNEGRQIKMKKGIRRRRTDGRKGKEARKR